MKAAASGRGAIIVRSRVRVLAVAGAAAMAITAVAAVAPVGPAAQAFSVDSPAITVADGNSVIATATSEDGLRFYWNEFGTNNWHGQQVAPDDTTYSAPSIAQVGNTVVIAAQGASDSLDLYWQTEGASGWHAETVAGMYTTFSAPSLAINIGAVNIAAEGPGDSLDYYWALNGTTIWHPEVVAGAGSIDSAPALSAHDGFANIVALVSNGIGSVFYWAANGTTTWTPSTMPGGDTGASSIAAYPGNPGGVHVVARELFGGLAVQTDVNGSGTWQYTLVCSGGLTRPGCAVGVPSVTMNGSSVNIAVEDFFGNLDFWWQDSSGNFHQEQVDTAADL